MWFIFPVAVAAPSLPDRTLPPPAWNVDLSRICLPSGLVVDIVKRPETGVVTVTTVVGGGTSSETDATRGAAHLAEHLWFQSTPGGGPRVWDLEAGLRMEAYTEADAVVFSTLGGPDDLDRLVALEVERLRDPLQGVTEATVAAERRVIASELRYRGEHAERAAVRWIDTALWPADHPYAATVASLEAADALRLEAVKSFVAATHQPGNVAIRIEGALEPERVQEALQAHAPDDWFRGSTKDCGHPPTRGEPPAPRSIDLAVVRAPVWRPQLWLGWSLPAADPAKTARHELAVAVLDEVLRQTAGFSRRRGTDEVQQGCRLLEGRLASRVVCQLEFPDEASVKAMLGQVRGTLDHQWGSAGTWRDEAIVARAIEIYLDAFAALDGTDGDRSGARAEQSWLATGDPTALLVDSVFTVKPDDLAALARKYLGPDRMTSVLLLPSRPEASAGGGVQRVDPYAFPELPDWKPGVPTLRAESQTLANGLRTWSAARADAPYLARSTLVSRGGWTTGPLGATEVLQLTAFPVFEVPWDEVAGQTAHTMYLEFGQRSVEAELTGPDGRLDAALWAHRHLTAMEVDLESRQTRIDHTLAPFLERLGHVGGLTVDELGTEHLLGTDRAAAAWWTRANAAKLVSTGDVLRWQRAIWRPSTSVLVVTSPLEAVRVKGGADKRLADWKEPKKVWTGPPAALPPPPEAHTWLVQGESVTSTVSAICRAAARTDENEAAWAVLLPILDRALFTALREGLGLYVADAGIDPLDERVALLRIVALAPPDRAAAAVDAVREVLKGAAAVPEPVLAWGRLAAEGDLSADLSDAQGTHRLLVRAAREGRSLPDPTALRTHLGAVTAADLSAILGDCVGHEAITVTGPPAPGLAGQELDWVERDRAIAQSLR